MIDPSILRGVRRIRRRYAEALDDIEREADRDATIAASALASRATYAGPSPEVHTPEVLS